MKRRSFLSVIAAALCAPLTVLMPSNPKSKFCNPLVTKWSKAAFPLPPQDDTPHQDFIAIEGVYYLDGRCSRAMGGHGDEITWSWTRGKDGRADVV